MNPTNPFVRFLKAQNLVLLDGGLATELEVMGHDLKHPFWSSRLLLEKPEAIKEVHQKYLAVGSQCLSTATYQLSFLGSKKLGISPGSTAQLFTLAVQLAKSAIDDFETTNNQPRPLVAGSLGPYGAYLCDGSEYSGHYQVSRETLRSFHIRRWEEMIKAHCDLIALETIPNMRETEVLRRMSEDFPQHPFWISFTCRNGTQIRDSNLLRDAANLFHDCDNLAGIGINCTDPKLVSDLIGEIKAGAPGTAILAYPNSGESYHGNDRRWTGLTTVDDFTKMAKQWHLQGAEILGGCCRTTPDHIDRIRHDVLDV
jgi:homocysteine S-methyltransferase